MNYNPGAIRQIRQQRDAAVRTTFRSNKKSGPPRVKLSQFQNGQYRFRIWPLHDKNNPFGMHRQKVHLIEKVAGGGPFKNPANYQQIQCPRSTNMDPMPKYFEDPIGTQYAQYVDGLDLEPVYVKRCACCELLVLAKEYEPMMDDGLKLAMVHLAGGDQGDCWFIPCSFNAKIVEKSNQPFQDDPSRTWTKIVYGPNPDPSELIHCLLMIPEGYSILDKLFRMTEMVPDYGNIMLGRWWWLNKASDGRGANGYDVICEPNPSPAGFEIPDNMYPDFSKWGSGGGQRPSTRLEYPVQEAHITQAWWAPELRKFGIPLTDAEAAAQSHEDEGPNPFAAMQNPGWTPF